MSPSLMRMSSVGRLSQKNPQSPNQRKPPPRVPNQCRLTPLLRRPLWRSPKNQLKRSNPPNWFPGWKEVIHPSRLVVAAGQISLILQGPKWRPCSQSSGGRMVWQQQPDESKVQINKSEPPSPTKELEIIQQVMLPPSFMGVTACLQRDPSPEKVHEVLQDPLRIIAAVLEPVVATMSASCIVKDKAMGWPIWTLWPLQWDEWLSVVLSRRPQLRGPS